jgi:hypothetical protein
MVVEELIWSFGRTPPVGCCGVDSDRTSCWHWWRLRSWFRDQAQNLLEHLPWDGDLGHLEGDIAAVADDLLAKLQHHTAVEIDLRTSSFDSPAGFAMTASLDPE